MRKQRTFYAYILTNAWNTVLYTGMTNNLNRRINEHKTGVTRGFSFKYNLKKLVYYERIDGAISAIAREKQIEAGSRKRKIALVEGLNPNWHDLSEDL
jgi:putative endonuclease